MTWSQRPKGKAEDNLKQSKKAKAPKLTGPKGGADRHHMSLSLPPERVEQLKTVMGWMLTDPERHEPKPCFQTTVLYALDHAIANPPAHVRAAGG